MCILNIKSNLPGTVVLFSTFFFFFFSAYVTKFEQKKLHSVVQILKRVKSGIIVKGGCFGGQELCESRGGRPGCRR